MRTHPDCHRNSIHSIKFIIYHTFGGYIIANDQTTKFYLNSSSMKWHSCGWTVMHVCTQRRDYCIRSEAFFKPTTTNKFHCRWTGAHFFANCVFAGINKHWKTNEMSIFHVGETMARKSFPLHACREGRASTERQ